MTAPKWVHTSHGKVDTAAHHHCLRHVVTSPAALAKDPMNPNVGMSPEAPSAWMVASSSSWGDV
jgi:hypothetical protein